MMENYFENSGIKIPEIILPAESFDMGKWAVVAVDQFTSEPEYWRELENYIGDAPSSLGLVLPEVYLGTDKEAEITANISANMIAYPEKVLTRKVNGVILVKRTVDGLTRTGVVLALDLEKYDFRPGSGAKIAATEKTVFERIPPRVAIRREATVELPHVMILMNDAKNAAISVLENAEKEKIYDFELSMKGGHIEGYAICDAASIGAFSDKVAEVLPLAVGDGNHSFAAAKAYWEELKKAGAPEDHPARFALCEIENIFDEGIAFEPIHRVVFGFDYDEFIDKMSEFFGENAGFAEDFKVKFEEPDDDNENYHKVNVISGARTGTLYVDKKYAPLCVAAVQGFIDTLPEGTKVDYVHNLENTVALSKNNNVGILLPAMPKAELFNVVKRGEVLPKKTFSMGKAESKRYYLEARRIRQVK